MPYDHSLTAHIQFKTPQTIDAVCVILKPLAEHREWTPDHIVLGTKNHGYDEIGLSYDASGLVTDVSLYTAGDVEDSFIEAVRSLASVLGCYAKPGYIDICDHDTDAVSDAIKSIWYGKPGELERARARHGWAQAVEQLRIHQVPSEAIRHVLMLSQLDTSLPTIEAAPEESAAH